MLYMLLDIYINNKLLYISQDAKDIQSFMVEKGYFRVLFMSSTKQVNFE